MILAMFGLSSVLTLLNTLNTELFPTELRATGETVRRRDRTADEELTPQELQIALHAAEGESNREIGAALFLSPRTVEFHLARVYRKLSIHSRAELIRRFSAGQASPRPGG
jgi:DNA-binding NarL/FixJ family response regulator